MHKTKKKTKTAKLPKPIKVKKEKSDEDRLPQPMTHYLDDRLEMIKQIFNTLKPKTIINLAPDFLKTQALEDIEEACLNELLCISTKRLKSIIAATKCPTDTESSDNDSDVERQEEHISLEEISSDSEIEGSSSRKGKKKKATKTTQETAANKKDNSNEDNQVEDGQISVLELLELQARARAIRSQLALEPVTKIEVDSDEEKRKGDKDKTSKKDVKTNKSSRKRLSDERELNRDSAKISRANDATESCNTKTTEMEAEKRTTKRVKLKRNYRNSANNEKEDELVERGNSVIEMKENNENSVFKDKLKQSEIIKNKESAMVIDIKKEKKSRSPSPDVIPIVAEPETLLITDSSDEEHKKTTEDNEKTEKVSAQTDIVKEQTERKSNEKEAEKPNEKIKNSLQQESNAVVNKTEQNTSDEEKIISGNTSENIQDSEANITTKNDTQSDNNKAKNLQTKNSLNKKSNNESNSANSDEDRNDDVISLGGDLENEMNEELEKEVNALQSPYNKKSMEDSSQDNNKSQDESQTEDVISLESSEDERTDDNQSWHSRYMKSSKVSKVLAASRLGKRVRDKIKKSKHLKKDAHHENTDADKEKSAIIFTSKHEDGSVEQYKELLEMRQRKQT